MPASSGDVKEPSTDGGEGRSSHRKVEQGVTLEGHVEAGALCSSWVDGERCEETPAASPLFWMQWRLDGWVAVSCVRNREGGGVLAVLGFSLGAGLEETK